MPPPPLNTVRGGKGIGRDQTRSRQSGSGIETLHVSISIMDVVNFTSNIIHKVFNKDDICGNDTSSTDVLCTT